MLDQDMDRFVEEQRAKLAEERRNLDLNPSSAAPAEQNKAFVDNQPQYQQQPPANTRPETPKIFKLGEDYKRFRNNLNQQRQQEYLSRTQGGQQKGDYQQAQPQQRQVPQPTRPEYVKQTSDLGLSLPIRDHPSAKERLRQERNREYNEMLRRNRERGARSYQPPSQPQQAPQLAAAAGPSSSSPQRQQQQQRQPQNNPPTTTAVVAPTTRKRWEQQQPSNSNSNNNSSVLPNAEEPSAGTRGLRARRRADDDGGGLDLLAAARREADEYMREKRRQLDAYNETLQKRLEADAYAAQKRQEADEYARNKIRDAETYQELLERKRLEERLYRGGAGEDLLPLRGPGGVEYVPVRRRRRRRSEYYDDDNDEYDDDYYEVVDDRAPRRRRSNKPRVIRHVIDDDESSLATNDHIASVPIPSSRRETGRSDQPQQGRDNRGGRSDRYGGGKPNSAEQQQDLSARGRKSNEYDTPAQVRSRSAPPEQENAFTGLPIGERENYDAAARKKEQYRRELEQQMREKQQQKKDNRARDRSDERSPARDDAYRQKRVTYADEQHQGGISNIGHNNIAPVGVRRRRSDSEGDVDNFKRRLPPKPILNNNQQNTQPPLTYRAGPAPPQSSSQPEPISAHDQAYFYYGTRNPLDPTFPAGAVVPASSGVATSYPPPQQPTSNTNVRNVNISPTRKSSDLVIKSLNGQTGLFVDDDSAAREKQEKLIAYQQELRRQVEEKRREKERSKEEQERYDLRKDKEAREYNPWGKGGAGAPMRDVNGNLVSDLRQIRHNADAEPARKIVDHSIPVQPLQLSSPRYNDNSDPLGNTPRTFGRSNPFENKQTAQQKSQKDLYKEELQRQIDERKREEAVRKEKQRLEDEKEERRLEEQNKKMQQEFEEEQRKKQEKIEEQKRKNEELQRQIEDQKREDERKRREQLSNREDEIRKQKDRELEDKLRQSQAAGVQQPQPTARTARRAVIADGEKIPRTPVGPPQSTRPPPSNRNPPTNRNPPPSSRNQPPPESYRRKPATQRGGGEEKRSSPRYIYSRDSSRISRELSALRRQLLDEQRRIENQLGSDDDALKLNSQILDLSRLRPQQRPVQVPVRPRPRPQVALNDPQREHPDQMALKEFNDFKYKSDETASLRIFKSEYPEQPVDSTSLERQQAELIRNQVRNIESLKLNEPVVIQQQPPAAPVVARQSQQPHTNLQVNYPPPPRTANSLLETETTYIPISDELPPTPQPQQRRGGARERRREVRDKENKSSPTPPSPSVRSMSITDVELLAGRNQKRLRNLDGTQQSTNTALPPDSISLNDPDEILKQFVNSRGAGDDAENILAASGRSNKRSASVITNESEPWLRPQSRN